MRLIRRTSRGAACAAALALAAPLRAHVTGSFRDEPLGWSWEPSIWLPLLAALLVFGTGWLRLYRRASNGHPLRRKVLLFAAGWTILSAALLSPLHAAGERSFAAHMVEHELLMLAAAPLLVLSEPLGIMLWAFASGGRRALGTLSHSPWLRVPWSALTAPLFATFLQAAALWLWHAPSLFDRALASDGWHIAQHLSFLISALLFWTAMLDRTTPRGVAALCLFFTSLISGGLGALMAFSQSPWYAGYARLGMSPLGLTPVEDQQAAGLIMWVPGGLVHAAAALLIIRAALRLSSSRGAPAHAG
jgi:cytochrome c oxidase assembly factor CtaG